MPPANLRDRLPRLTISKIAAANCPRSCDFADFRFGSKADDLCVTESRPLHPTQRTNAEASLNVRWAMCGRLRAVKGLSTSQGWSEQPCVRPISAAHRAAGHNALRGSGPGQKLAFDDALAHVGCPDHRPCWKHVSDMTGSALRAVGPFQPFHDAVAGAILSKVASPYRASAMGSL